ncbi:glycine zipper family protein [Burkholderia plantarii]|nr:glycine zipper family protein [Burkholderia plantarii]
MTAAVCLTVAAGLLLSSSGALAQESANGDLNSCVKKEQVLTTVKGVGIGALAGVSAMFIAHKSQDAGKAALIGAVAGGIAGFATAYYTAVDTCFKKNPSWLPESDIQRTRDYDNVRNAIHYKKSQGVVTRVESVDVAGPVKPDSQAEVNSTFILMTPDGAEAPVTIERKLYVVDKDKQTELPFPGRNAEQRTFEPGEQKDVVHIPIPHDAKPGSVYRVEFRVTANNLPPASASNQFTIAE